MLTQSDLIRYERQILYSDFGEEGQKRLKESHVVVAGLGGSMKYNNGSNQFTEFEMALKIIKILPRLLINRIFYGRWLDILLTHAPPRGLGDREDSCHQGFKIFRTFLKLFKPKYLLHGHIHLYDINAPREIIFMETKIVNIYEHQIIKIEVP